MHCIRSIPKWLIKYYGNLETASDVRPLTKRSSLDKSAKSSTCLVSRVTLFELNCLPRFLIGLFGVLQKAI